MDINQLLSDLAILVGILLVAVLAVGPLWLDRDAKRRQTRRDARATTSPTSSPGRGTSRMRASLTA